MNEHKFRSVYSLGYGDAMRENRKSGKAARTIAVAIVVMTAVVAFWAGRVSVENRVSSEYGAGFDAGVREGTTQWEEWK